MNDPYKKCPPKKAQLFCSSMKKRSATSSAGKAGFALEFNMEGRGVIIRMSDPIAATILVSLPVGKELIQEGQNALVVICNGQDRRWSRATCFRSRFNMATRRTAVGKHQKLEPLSR